MIAYINTNVADIRREPDNRSERTSQGLFNEQIEIIDDSTEFSRVKFVNGYEGWIGKQFLGRQDPTMGKGPFVVQSDIAGAFERTDFASKRKTVIPFGCHLYGAFNSGYLKVDSERYGPIFIHEVNLIDKSNLVSPESQDDVIQEAEKFLGVPYLWGGRSFFGVDCSGYVGLIAQRFGISLKRDSKDQRTEGREIARKDIRYGDLIFFPGHVALAITKDLYIHSSRRNGGVAYNSLDPKSAIYNESLDKSFAAARRIFE